ncbi:DMT family transporter [Natronosporangium hydrolyticum]|uniref:DMT family transporter n=1 Tax=Natronosporangium hydrolyticum TaxID=2811111 RepID=A0A895YIU0_9ACTN|nr:DMT family transporter [Natronosporangium hydrolyticum]QSB15283.1 DMT family transporter [Natronosporangium hydrolyticum]
MPRRRALGVALAAASGLAMALQARINGELAVQIGDGVAAATISFAVGLVVLAAIVFGSPYGRRGLRAVREQLRAGTLRWWHCLGGLAGGFVVATQGLTVASLGVAVFTVTLVAGQSTSSLLVDRTTLPPSGPQAVTRTRVIGAGLCVLAVVVSVADRLGSPQTLGLALLPLAAGFGIAWQQAVNGRVRAAGGSTWPATFINFLTGLLGLLLGFGIGVLVRGWPGGDLPSEPWLYAGGLLGIAVIAVGAAVVRFTGVLLLGLAAISGQVLGALLLDLLVPADTPPAVNTYAGALLALTAVGIATLGSRRPARPTQS